MPGSADNLTPRRQKAVEALLAGASCEAAARTARVDPRTLRRWKRAPDFCEALKQGQRAMFDEALGVLRASALSAARALREVVEDRTAAPPVRVGAARVLLEQSMRAVEVVELEKRLERLEEAARKPAGRGGRWAA